MGPPSFSRHDAVRQTPSRRSQAESMMPPRKCLSFAACMRRGAPLTSSSRSTSSLHATRPISHSSPNTHIHPLHATARSPNTSDGQHAFQSTGFRAAHHECLCLALLNATSQRCYSKHAAACYAARFVKDAARFNTYAPRTLHAAAAVVGSLFACLKCAPR